ncbi:MAG: hypothetical protein EXS14_08505 [Planctomycetes bacterium]|nr:hypothetical protein [Planctomycetota bacterium]
MTLTLSECAQDSEHRVHFVGVAGAGMSALAQYRAFGAGRTSGSDRALDRGQQSANRASLERVGVQVFPQDGSGAATAAALITSSAVEAAIPDLAVARERGIPIFHRAELLGEYVRSRPSCAVAGTSGKSSVTEMLFEILRHAGKDPGLISGGDSVLLRAQGWRGNAWRGSGPLVVEADESDGSLVQHSPTVGIVLNLHRDHMEPAQVLGLFTDFLARTSLARIVGDEPECGPLRESAVVVGFSADATFRGEAFSATEYGCTFTVSGVRVQLPVPGMHNAQNALAAMAAAEQFGVDSATAAAALAEYRGVARRFEIVGHSRGVRVVDDYAHNPRKVAAVVRAAQTPSGRLFALFQPHGFGPTRFMRAELAELVPPLLRVGDHWCFAPIYDAGGSAERNVSSDDLAADFSAAGVQATVCAPRSEFLRLVSLEARAGDTILVLGGRDPGLADFACAVLSSLH